MDELDEIAHALHAAMADVTYSLTCQDCGKVFNVVCLIREPRAARCALCARARQNELRRERRKLERISAMSTQVPRCAHCGLPFLNQRSTARFCSTRCRVAHHRHSLNFRQIGE